MTLGLADDLGDCSRYRRFDDLRIGMLVGDDQTAPPSGIVAPAISSFLLPVFL